MNPNNDFPKIAYFVFQKMVLQDLIGPLGTLSFRYNAPDSKIIVSKNLEPIQTDILTITPTHSFATCPKKVDILIIPGGLEGTIECMKDQATLDWITQMANEATIVASVCTGSAILAATGLLRGKNATSHWSLVLDHVLELMEVNVVKERVVIDGKYITAAGVSSGIDLGIKIAQIIGKTPEQGEFDAKFITLGYEYDPQPLYVIHGPEDAPEQAKKFMNFRQEMINKCKEVAKQLPWQK